MARNARILLVEGIHQVAKVELEKKGFEVSLLSHALKDKELIKEAQGYHALGIRSKTQLTSDVLSSCPSLEVIGAFCIGTDQIDLTAANSLGIPVFNAPYSNTRSVAELVIGEIIALARRLGDRNTKAHNGIWDKSATGSYEIRGKTLGIVGYGHIGSQVSVLAESLGLQVVYYDVLKKLPLGNSRSCPNLHRVLELSDFVSLHVPETSDTQKMIGEGELAVMKKGSFLINASRGSVVKLQALSEAIRSGHLAGAAIDVFPNEPNSNKEIFQCELQTLPNVILTPHIGGSTEEAQEAIGGEVAESLIRFFSKGATFGAVQFPQLDVPLPKEGQRLLNVHQNVPGVLSETNRIFSDLGVNIVGQHLATDSNIGYLVMDFVSPQAKTVCEKISHLKTSIRTHLCF